ncbi:MAG TPA: hypothetical protein VM489_08780 [Burkholderiales bacterium]|nr:hypothetical protein [Burkholderiales bacterium]
MALPAVERRNFKIGKYDIVAQPAIGSAHMLRYTVLLNGKRLGALLSVPTESDCKFLECPPAVPPVKIFQVTHRPGRPKKNAAPAPAPLAESGPRGLRHEELSAESISLDIKRSD